jgi:hypothetical protein
MNEFWRLLLCAVLRAVWTLFCLRYGRYLERHGK